MDPLTALAAGDEIAANVERAKKYFKTFKPSVKHLVVNYRTGQAEMKIAFRVPAKGRIGNTVVLPLSERFRVTEMYDSEFNALDRVWRYSKKGWVMKARALPASSESFMVTLEGSVSSTGLRQFVEVTTPSTPFVGKTEDSYWLHASLTSPELLEAVYQGLEIDEVSVGVRVDVNRSFSTSMPPEIKRALEARSNVLASAVAGSRDDQAKAIYRLRHIHRATKATEADILRMIAALVSRRLFAEYVRTSQPYEVGRIDPDEGRITPIPECVAVDAFTQLNYGRKVAEGHLYFEREEYKAEISKRMGRLL